MGGEKPASGSKLPTGPVMDAHGRENRAGTLLPPGAPLAFHLLSKQNGAICKLDCTY